MPSGHTSNARPWRPASAARPLYWWSEAGLQSLADALQDAIAQWGAAWGMACEGSRVRCQPASQHPVPDGQCLALMARGEAHAWLTMPDDAGEELLPRLFPAAEACGPLARAVAASCRQDAIARIASLLGLECAATDAAPPTALVRTGSGAVQAEIPPLGARLLAGSDIALRWRKGSGQPNSTGAREPLVEATAAMVHQRLALSVDLEGCRIGVGALQGLQVGDVVRLEHGLANPAAIHCGAAPLCAAYLGRSGDRKAVELTARTGAVGGGGMQ